MESIYGALSLPYRINLQTFFPSLPEKISLLWHFRPKLILFGFILGLPTYDRKLFNFQLKKLLIHLIELGHKFHTGNAYDIIYVVTQYRLMDDFINEFYTLGQH